MNLTSLITVNYENKSNWKLGENKPNTNPIKPNLLNAQMNVNKVLTKDYENKPPFRTTAKQTQSKPVLSAVEWANSKIPQTHQRSGKKKSVSGTFLWVSTAGKDILLFVGNPGLD